GASSVCGSGCLAAGTVTSCLPPLTATPPLSPPLPAASPGGRTLAGVPADRRVLRVAAGSLAAVLLAAVLLAVPLAGVSPPALPRPAPVCAADPRRLAMSPPIPSEYSRPAAWAGPPRPAGQPRPRPSRPA